MKRNFWISAKEFSEIIQVRNDRFEDIDDDKYRKLGLIYFKKEDPAVFVEKGLVQAGCLTWQDLNHMLCWQGQYYAYLP